MTLTPFGSLSQVIRLDALILLAVLTPQILLSTVWPLPLSLATTRGISFDFSSSPYLDVSVQGVPHVNLLIQLTFHGSSPWEFPHSEICGSKLICSSPQLFAACRVLLRLLMPRHSPYALVRLNFFFSVPMLVLFLELLEFHKQISSFRLLILFSEKVLSFSSNLLFHLSVKL